MNAYCLDYNTEKHSIQNYLKISCCIEYIIDLYEISNNNLLTNKYGIFLIRTFNHYYKQKKTFFNEDSFSHLQLNKIGITVEMISKLIEIISKYSSYYYSNNKHDYAKLLITSGIEIINQSPFKNEKKIIKRKNALANNIACIYEKEKKYDKAELFLDKCIEMNKNKIDNAISYNNYGIIELKKKNIQMSIHYFHLMFKEIKDILNEDIKEENKSEVNLLFCFLLLNYFSITKNYSLKDYNKDIDKACIFTKKILGENHYITIKILKLKGENIFDLFNVQHLKKLNTLDADSSSEDEFNYIKKKNKKIDFNYSNNNSNIYIEDDDLIKKEKNSFFKSFDEKNESTEIRQSGTFNTNVIFEKVDTKIQKDDLNKINDNNNNINNNIINKSFGENKEKDYEKKNKEEIKKIDNEKKKFEEDFKIKDEYIKLEEEYKKLDEEKRKIEEEKKKLEKERKKIEEEKKINEEKKKLEEDKKNEEINKIKELNKIDEEKEIEEEKENKEEIKIEKEKKEEKKLEKNKEDINLENQNIIEENKMNLRETKKEFEEINLEENKNLELNKNNLEENKNNLEENKNNSEENKNNTEENKNNTENQTQSFLSLITEEPKVKLPFKKKKLTLKDCFSKVIRSTKPSSFDLFSVLLKKNNPFNKKNEKFQIKLNPVTNKYHELMIKLNNPEEKIIFNEYNPFDYINQHNVIIIGNENFSIRESNCNIKLYNPSIYKTSEGKSLKTTQFFKHFLSSGKGVVKLYPDYFESIIDFSVLDDMNNLFQNKIKNIINLKEEINRICSDENNKENNIVLREINQFVDNVNYQLSISNSQNEKQLIFNIVDLDNKKNEYHYSINHSRLYIYLEKLLFDLTMPITSSISFIFNLKMFVSKLLIRHCEIIKQNDKISLALLIFQKGINEKYYQFEFLQTTCFYTVVINKFRILFIIYNKKNPKENIQFTLFLDDGSYKLLFVKNTKTEKIIFNKDYDYILLFKDLIMKIEEILKIQNPNITFSDYLKNSPDNLYKINLENKLNKKELWIFSPCVNEVKSDLGQYFKWRVDFYSLTKIEISNNSFFIHKAIILNSSDFTNIIGMEPKNIFDLMSEKDKIITYNIFLNSVKMRNVMTQVLNEHNYDSMLRLMKINPSCFFRFKFVITHIKRYFCVAFEFLVYSKENYFLRLMLTETVTSRSYSKIYLPYNMFMKENDMSQLRKKLEEKYKISKKFFSDTKELRKIIENETQQILTKNPNIIIFENIDVILEKLKSIKNNSIK